MIGAKVDYHGTQGTVLAYWTGPVYEVELPGGQTVFVKESELKEDWR